MNIPNLASRPHLNVRPVWVMSVLVLILGLVIGGIDMSLYYRSSEDLAGLLVERDGLKARRAELIAGLQEHLKALDSVPWTALRRRVNSVNAVLGEHRFSWGRLLDDLGEVLPWQVRLVTVSPSHGEEGISLTIKAVSQDREGFLNFLDALVRDPRFSDPVPGRETWPESGETIQYLFNLEVRYDPEGEGR